MRPHCLTPAFPLMRQGAKPMTIGANFHHPREKFYVSVSKVYSEVLF